MSKPPPTPKEIAEAWATRVMEVECENGRLRAVVAAQREALRGFVEAFNVDHIDWGTVAEHWLECRAALDAEGVSEPGSSTSRLAESSLESNEGMSASEAVSRPGSLTSPVDTAPGAKP